MLITRLTPCALAVLSLSAAAPAFADEDTSSSPTQLETLQVRAKRLTMETGYKAERSDITGVNTSILDTPYSIDVVTQQQLEDKQPQTLEDAVTGISGLHQGNNLAGTLDAIVKRGYGGNRDHSIMRNGVESTQARNYTATAERVEVLKGPASVLYGVQDPGGVINIVSKKPLYKPKTASTPLSAHRTNAKSASILPARLPTAAWLTALSPITAAKNTGAITTANTQNTAKASSHPRSLGKTKTPNSWRLTSIKTTRYRSTAALTSI